MRITKFSHACVRIESGPHVIVLDPGSLSEREALDGASAVLVTHQHPDHLDVGHLAARDAPVYTIGDVADQIAADSPSVRERVRVVGPGESFDAGLPVRAVGEWHAVIHEELPRFHNSGYVVSVEGRDLFHPGDAFTVPDRPVDVLFLPVAGPWNKVSEVIDFARGVGAAQSLAVHEVPASEFGLGLVDAHVSGFLHDRGLEYTRLAAGQDLELS